MKSSLRPVVSILAGWFASTALVRAHPGHDDGHELTWDLGHLAAHPLATLGCVAVVSIAVWAGWQIVRRRLRAQPQSFRGSHASRGK